MRQRIWLLVYWLRQGISTPLRIQGGAICMKGRALPRISVYGVVNDSDGIKEISDER